LFVIIYTSSHHSFSLLWQITKLDIAGTLNGVCNKVLHDHSVSKEIMESRRLALGILGAEYCARGVSVNQGLEDLMKKIGAQSGMFPQGDASSSAEGATAGEGADADATGAADAADGNGAAAEAGGVKKGVNGSGDGDNGDEIRGSGTTGADEAYLSTSWTSNPDAIRKAYHDLPTFSVKELRERIAMLGGHPHALIEKSEFQTELRRLLLPKLSTADLRALLIEKIELSKATDSPYECPMDPHSCDRDMLLDLLPQSHP
jgi:hypothetical protein